MFWTGTLKSRERKRKEEKERERKRERLENDEGISFILIYKEAEIFSQAIAGGHPLLRCLRNVGEGRLDGNGEGGRQRMNDQMKKR